MPYVIAQPCVDVKDKACVDECPVDCIYEGSRSLYINPNECVDCGACEPVCPTEAIFYEDDLPDEWAWYKDAAVSFFAEVGDRGGAGGEPVTVTRIATPFPRERRCATYGKEHTWVFTNSHRPTTGRASHNTKPWPKPRPEA